MFKPQSATGTASLNPEPSRHHPPFVQAESELIEVQLEALAQGLMKLTTFYTRFLEEELLLTLAKKQPELVP